MNFERLAREFVRALRDPRSQAALSRRLKCRSNVIYAWESGSAVPTAARSDGCVSSIEWTGNEVGSGERRFARCRWCGAAGLALLIQAREAPAPRQGLRQYAPAKPVGLRIALLAPKHMARAAPACVVAGGGSATQRSRLTGSDPAAVDLG